MPAVDDVVDVGGDRPPGPEAPEGAPRRSPVRAWLALPTPHERFPCLDGMRAVAALTVFAFHAGRRTAFVFSDAHPVLDRLNLGVAIFFVLSGFLITRPFVAAHLSGVPDPGLRSYARRRVLRIYPAYLVALMVLWRLGEVTVKGDFGLLKHATLLSDYFRYQGGVGVGVAWTLTVEVTFYAFVPLWSVLMRWAGRWAGAFRAEAVGALALTVLGFASVWWLYPDRSAWPGARVLPPALSSLGLGMLLAVLSARSDTGWSWAPRLRRAGGPAGLWWLAAVAVYGALVHFQPLTSIVARTITRGHALERAWQVPVALLLVVPMVFGDQRRGLIRRALATPVMVFVGTVSYALYLWHYYVLRAVVPPIRLGEPPRLWSDAGWSLIALALSLAIAALSWYLVERPCLRWARRPLLRRRTRAPAAAG